MSEMDCTAVQRLLGAYHDGELEGSDKDAVSAHLAHCSACLQKLEGIRRIDDIFDATIPPDPNPVLWDRVREDLSQVEFNMPSRASSRVRWLAAAVVLVAAVAVGWSAYFAARIASAQRPIDLGHYLDNRPPVPANWKTVSLDDICKHVDFPILKALELPRGYTLSSPAKWTAPRALYGSHTIAASQKPSSCSTTKTIPSCTGTGKSSRSPSTARPVSSSSAANRDDTVSPGRSMAPR